MKSPWSSDFSYSYFKKLLHIARSRFVINTVSQGPQIVNNIAKNHLILRHDVDVSLHHALKMAKVEHTIGVCSTYMILVKSLLFSLEDNVSRSTVRQMVHMGHEVGLHFNIDGRLSNVSSVESIKKEIIATRKLLEKIIEQPVLSISFHRPRPEFTHGPFKVNGMVNGYAKELTEWFLSDSRGYWREGEPLLHLLKPKRRILQLLIHPIWWGETHMSAKDRLEDFFNKKRRGMQKENARLLSEALRVTVPSVIRNGDVA